MDLICAILMYFGLLTSPQPPAGQPIPYTYYQQQQAMQTAMMQQYQANTAVFEYYAANPAELDKLRGGIDRTED